MTPELWQLVLAVTGLVAGYLLKHLSGPSLLPGGQPPVPAPAAGKPAAPQPSHPVLDAVLPLLLDFIKQREQQQSAAVLSEFASTLATAKPRA